MMGWSPRCYIPTFVEIGPLVPEKILKIFTIYGHGGHLGHVTWTIYTNTNRAVQSQKTARGLKFMKYRDYPICVLRKQRLCSDVRLPTADLRLCFRICREPVFSCRGSLEDFSTVFNL